MLRRKWTNHVGLDKVLKSIIIKLSMLIIIAFNSHPWFQRHIERVWVNEKNILKKEWVAILQ
jgi:hypothetical protein